MTLTGSAAISATGNALDNVLVGNAAANELDGRGGVDQMAGGDGNDTYTVADAGDLVSENAGEGTDTVLSSVTHALAANVERLTLTGSAAINGTGNDLDNVLRGNSGNNVLAGAAGDDTYVVGSGDTVVENAGEGYDAVLAGIAWTLDANVEALTLTGAAAIAGTGNALDNAITGNAGANALDGGGGADTLAGGAGDDSYAVDSLDDVVSEAAGEGTDTVRAGLTWTLGANLENLVLAGTVGIDGTGNALANVLTGNAGANTLDGGAGADTLAGGAGNDGYAVDDAGDVVVENAGDGRDTVLATVSYTLGANVENLTLTGTDAIAGTGNDLANVLRGNAAANVLAGAAGDDSYFVDVGDTVVETAGGGTDTVRSSINWALEENVENLRWALSRTTNYTAVMNYMGARFSADKAAMEPIMAELARRGLGYLDDGSSARSVAPELALHDRVPLAVADTAIDAEQDRGAILKKLDQLEATARAKGFAIGVGSAGASSGEGAPLLHRPFEADGQPALGRVSASGSHRQSSVSRFC